MPKYIKLEEILRKGWLMRNVSAERIESVADHTLQLIMLGSILTKELDGKKITLIFHGKSDETSVSGFTGTNLLTQKTFDGKLGSFETVVLE